MKVSFKRSKICMISFLILGSIVFPIFINLYSKSSSNVIKDYNLEKNEKIPSSSNSNHSNVIVFFNTSMYDSLAKQKFEFCGGKVKIGEDWNNLFNSFSGFAGEIPLENISLLKAQVPGINIEYDEIIRTQMNYVSLQTNAISETWFVNGLKGDTDASIAVLDTGIDPDHEYLQSKIVGWENFVNEDPISDDNGHGTFISSVIAGTGNLPYNSGVPSSLNIQNNFTHLERYDEFLPSKNYSFKLISFNTSKIDSNFVLDTFCEFKSSEVDNIWFEVYYNSNLVNLSTHQNPDVFKRLYQDISQHGLGIYDVYIKYHKKSNTNPCISYSLNVTFFPETYIQNFNHFNGIANATKILSYKVANKSGSGYVSDLISALASVIQNRTIHKILAVCLSMATSGSSIRAINRVIDEVIDNNILVVIAAGNSGVLGPDSLNGLAMNKKAIVVGATNDKDQLTSYSSIGKEVSDDIVKPDLVAPGGSIIKGFRNVISAGKSPDLVTSSYGTSISAGIVATAINMLVEAKWFNWDNWNTDDPNYWVKYLKAILCMTASETNLDREEDPTTNINEASYSPTSFNGMVSSLKDVNEGYGRINIQSAIDALTKSLLVNESLNGYLESSKLNPLSNHVLARKINLVQNTQYLFNLTNLKEDTNFDLFLYSNSSTQEGEPILLQSSRKWYQDVDYFYFTPRANETNCVLVVKAIEGNSNFTISFSPVINDFIPELEISEIQYVGGSKNNTVISLQEFYGNEPLKNYTIDQYWFYIDYSDQDISNAPPQEVSVLIMELAANYTLNKINPFDSNFTDGATFRSQAINFPSSGLYHYHFIASDGNNIVRFPETGELEILIEFPTDSKQFPYSHSFNNGLNSWTFNGTGWGLLNQSNFNDNRSSIHENNWSSIYFGREHYFPQNYTYQPYFVSDPYSNGTLRSPLFNLTQINLNDTQPFAFFGLRVSFNIGDAVYLQINLNWTGWDTLIVYSNIEKDWFIEKINLTDYIGNFLQFRFLVVLDDQYDPFNYKGLFLDFFSLENYTNNFEPEIEPRISLSLSNFDGFKYSKFIFICNYYDKDNNYPEYIYVEIGGNNISMINLHGNWNASHEIFGERGIRFIRGLSLLSYSNLSFRFHASDGQYTYSTSWYNQDNSLINFKNPEIWEFEVIQDEKRIGYEFGEDLSSSFYVSGTPIQKEITAWLLGDNTWHSITILGKTYLYAGLGQSFGSLSEGYGNNWRTSLVSHPIKLESEHSVYLQFYHEVDLENEFFIEENLDSCSVFISRNYGENWNLIEKFTFDDENIIGNQSFDITGYSNEIVMFKFEFFSNENMVGLGGGWLISDIYVGYDKKTDFIPPRVSLLTPLANQRLASTVLVQANLSDNKALDLNRLYVYINEELVAKNKISFEQETGLLSFQWDTTYHFDGNYQIKIKVYDLEGNIGEQMVDVYVENGIFNMRIWGPWIIIIISSIIVIAIIYVYSEKKGKAWFVKMRDTKAEVIRLKDIDKEQALKRIELFESEAQFKRPIILHCKFCKSWFESEHYNYICPVCEHDQIYAAYNCINCKKWYFKDEPGDNYFCTNKKCEGIKIVRRDLEEVKEILGQKGIFLRKFHNKKKKFSILD